MPEPFSILELRRQSAASGRRGGRWLIVIIAVAVLFLLFNVFVYFIAPGMVKRQLERRLGDALHRAVAVQAVHLNPYVLSVTIDGLAISDRDNRLLFGCGQLYVNFDSWSFFSGKWIFQAISLTAPAARLEINKDGTLNISDLLAPSVEKSPAVPPSKPRPVVIGQLTVTQARFDFADHSRAQDFATELGPLSFSLKDFSTAPAPGAPYEFTASTEAGESLHWRGTLSADPLRSAGEFALSQVALKKYSPYYAGLVGSDVLAGKLDVSGRYELDLSSEPRVMKLVGGEAHLRTLQLAPRGASAPAIELPAVDLTGLAASLAPMKVSIAKFALTGGRIAVQRASDGAINLLTMLAPPNSGVTSPPAAVPAAAQLPAAPDISLADLEIHGLALTLDDATTPRPAHNAIDSFDLSAQNLSLAPSAPPAAFKLALRFAPQGSLNLGGTFALSPLHADLTADLADLPLAGASPYVEPFLNIRIAQGSVAAHGQLTLALPTGSPPQIAYHGDAELDRVATVDGAAAEDFASLASLGFKQIDFTSAPFALGVGQISLIEPSLHLMRHRDGTTNLATVLRSETPDAVSPAPPATPAAQPAIQNPKSALPKITVGRVVLTDGALTFVDRSIEPNARVAISQLAGFIADLSSDDSARATVDLRAKVDNSAPAAIAGQLNPFGSAAFTDLTTGITSVDLQPASTYLGKYAGYTLARGSLSLDLKIRLEQRRLDSQNVATLDQFTLGDKTNSPDATGLPVRLAIALLKDTNGKIVIDLPIQGSLDDPDFRIGRVVVRVIVNLLTKAATAPFALLGSMFGGGDQQLDRIDFAPGMSTFTETETKKLDVVARALKARPGLNLDLTGAADPDAETPVLQKQKLIQLLRTKIWESLRDADPSLPPPDQLKIKTDDYNRMLSKLYFATFPPVVSPPSPPAAVSPAPPAPQAKGVAPKTSSGGPSSPSQPSLFSRIYGFFFGPSKSSAGPEKKPVETTPAPAPQSTAQTPAPAQRVIIQPAEMEARLAEQIPIDADDLHQLASDRAQHVKDYLIAQNVPAERIFLTDENAGSGSAPAQPAARVTLQLK